MFSWRLCIANEVFEVLIHGELIQLGRPVLGASGPASISLSDIQGFFQRSVRICRATYPRTAAIAADTRLGPLFARSIVRTRCSLSYILIFYLIFCVKTVLGLSGELRGLSFPGRSPSRFVRHPALVRNCIALNFISQSLSSTRT